jgi:glycosyltransferase involved in cell wall biosynthesis
MPADIATTPVQFSIIIPIYNDWEPLHGCLESVAAQTGTAQLEVIVVDDGSQTPAPESIRRFGSSLRLTIAWQSHAGIAAARNQGIQEAKGATLLFTDADCRLDPSCLETLNEAMSDHPEYDCFQLRVAGDKSTILGKAEDLRLGSIQDHLIQPNGCIRYLNTAGFAIRRSAIEHDSDVFDQAALRSEDTLLLVELMRDGTLPLFVSGAVVRHSIQMSMGECIRKDVRVAWLESRTFNRIEKSGVRIRMTNAERIAMLRSLWRASATPSIGKPAWFFLVARQALQRSISVLYRCLPHRRSHISASR